MSGELDTLAGILGQALDELREIRRLLARTGDAGELLTARWDPAELPGGPRATYEYDHRGSFAGVAIYNTSAGAIRVSFTSNGASAARGGDFTLSARGFLVVPYSGAHISVGGDAAGSAFVVLLAFAPQPNAGTF